MKSTRHAKAYQNAERQAFAESDDPHALIAILFDELLRRMNQFAIEVEEGPNNNLEQSEHYSRSLAILYGLQSSLNFEVGGEIANNLFRLYEYSRQQLLNTTQTKEVMGLKTAIESLDVIRDAWHQLGNRTKEQTGGSA
ncbi:MAG: hypothetical protein CBB97_25025 [Candidatus Endolissoclinum sp. TMED37]|nr:MAG: hypothetical protein CBB97_25025 [Candidatus Endolissoclinum sp. TMED37]|tara:strand:+ start:1404 stop:1820 length:417 start_codon:yes stop_codon:yes gene_type:complete